MRVNAYVLQVAAALPTPLAVQHLYPSHLFTTHASVKPQIAVEGNIAAGKSTLLERLQDMPGGAQIVVEPVEKWQTLVPGDDGNIMARMYVNATCTRGF